MLRDLGQLPDRERRAIAGHNQATARPRTQRQGDPGGAQLSEQHRGPSGMVRGLGTVGRIVQPLHHRGVLGRALLVIPAKGGVRRPDFLQQPGNRGVNLVPGQPGPQWPVAVVARQSAAVPLRQPGNGTQNSSGFQGAPEPSRRGHDNLLAAAEPLPDRVRGVRQPPHRPGSLPRRRCIHAGLAGELRVPPHRLGQQRIRGVPVHGRERAATIGIVGLSGGGG